MQKIKLFTLLTRRVATEYFETPTLCIVLDELADCLPDTEGLSVTDELILRGAIDSFLASLPEQTRTVFMRRYWYMMPIARVAYESGMTESNVKTTLHRTRLQFKEHLEKEGIVI